MAEVKDLELQLPVEIKDIQRLAHLLEKSRPLTEALKVSGELHSTITFFRNYRIEKGICKEAIISDEDAIKLGVSRAGGLATILESYHQYRLDQTT